MKRYNVQLAGLALIFAIFAFGVVISMEQELPEKEPQFMGAGKGDLPELPSDVKKLIAEKTLRLILDEAEDNPEMLMKTFDSDEKQEKLKEAIGKGFMAVLSYSIAHVFDADGKPIDLIVLLVENGANPNTKNYNGNTITSLLTRYFINMPMGQVMAVTVRNNLDALGLKLKLLASHKIDFNEEFLDGTTAAHQVIRRVLSLAHQEASRYGFIKSPDEIEIVKAAWSFIISLKALGFDFTTIKDMNGKTACEWAQDYTNTHNISTHSQTQLNNLCSPPKAWWQIFK